LHLCCQRLFARQPQGVQARQLGLLGRLVYVSGNNRIGRDAGLRQQRQPSWAGGR
jgi:hypothetical protein